MRLANDNGSVLILVYHSVVDSLDNPFYKKNQIEKKVFEKHLRILRNKFNVTSLGAYSESLKNKENSKVQKSVILTFDDGYGDNFSNSYGLLLKHKIPATIFLTTDFIDKKSVPLPDIISYVYNKYQNSPILRKIISKLNPGSKNQNLNASLIDRFIENTSSMSPKQRTQVSNSLMSGHKLNKNFFDDLMLNWEQVKDMDSSGLVTFGSHSKTHPVLSKLAKKESYNEIASSKRRIERWLKKDVRLFSFPYGNENCFSEREIEILKAAGYDCAVTWINGMNNSDSNPFMLKRVSPSSNLLKFQMKLKHYDLFQKIKSLV